MPARAWLLFLVAAYPLAAGCARADATLPDDVAESAAAYREGSPDAPIHVIYFDDYVCDDCAKFSREAVTPLRERWVATARARLTLVDLAWHRGSVAGSTAAVCAAEQGRFWPMHELLFERQEVWKRTVDIPATLRGYAAELGLNRESYDACAARRSHQRRLEAAEEESRRFAVRGTPAFVINGRLFYGSQQWGWVEQVLEAHARGNPDEAPPPPFRIPTRSVVDSARLRQIQDSLARLGATPGS